MSEVHDGPEGGVCSVRIGKEIFSCHTKWRSRFLLGFEPVETLQHRCYKDSHIVTNTRPLFPSAYLLPCTYPNLDEIPAIRSVNKHVVR